MHCVALGYVMGTHQHLRHHFSSPSMAGTQHASLSTLVHYMEWLCSRLTCFFELGFLTCGVSSSCSTAFDVSL